MAAGFDDELASLVEHLAARCPHTPVPCQACTNLAVEAVTTLRDTGWWAQIRRFQSRPRTPQETR